MKWIRRGWGSNYSPEFDSRLLYRMDFISNTPSTTPLLEISKRVITEITKTYPGPYYLMLSGGADSQTMLWLWLNSGVPFIPVSTLYTHLGATFNRHDLIGLEACASAYNLTIHYQDLNIIDFLENELPEYVVKYQCTSPQICTHMKMSEMQDGGTKIFSGNFVQHASYDYTILGLERYADSSGNSVIPFFLLHDQELAVRAPAMPHSNEGIDATKLKCLESLSVPILGGVKKQTGFEKIKEFYDLQSSRVPMIDRLKYSKKPSKRTFDLLFRYKMEELVQYQDKIVFKNK